MINPTRHPLARAALGYLRQNPGSTAEEITSGTMPTELRITRPFVDAAQRKAVLAARADYGAKISGVLARLTSAGFVEPLRPPRVAPWFATRADRDGVVDALAALVRHDHPPQTAATLASWARMVDEVRKSPGSWRPRGSGAAQETYRALVGLGVIESPAQRWATPEGPKTSPGDANDPEAVPEVATNRRPVVGPFGGQGE